MCERLNERQKRECNNGEECCVFKRPEHPPSYDKGGHKERSIANQPNHLDHWKKVEHKNYRVNLP